MLVSSRVEETNSLVQLLRHPASSHVCQILIVARGNYAPLFPNYDYATYGSYKIHQGFNTFS